CQLRNATSAARQIANIAPCPRVSSGWPETCQRPLPGLGRHALWPPLSIPPAGKAAMPASALMNVMTGAARKAGRGLARDFGEVEQLQVSVKGPANFVSAADHRSEETLFRELQKARPGYSFLMEERGLIEGPDKTHRWIVDPLDGTTNFLHGIPLFCIAIGLE